jgi:hypothetical protein
MTYRRALAAGLAALVLPACSVQRSGTGPDKETGGTTHAGGTAGTGGQPVAQGGAGNATGGSGDGGSSMDDSGAGPTGGGGSGGSVGTDAAIADHRSEPSAACEAFPNAEAYGGHCYWSPSGTMSWPDARTSCQNDGGDLASLASAAEDAWVTTAFAATLAQNGWAWLGLTDRQALTSTNIAAAYAWADGEPFAYTNWSQADTGAQPDHWCGPCDEATCCQHRGVLGTDGAWYDRSETDINNYLCEAVP